MHELFVVVAVFLSSFVSVNSFCARYCDGESKCVHEWDFCDGVVDCVDGTDEVNCCQGGQRCDKGVLCYPTDYRCDGIAFCLDGSDEKDCPFACPSYKFSCDSGKACIASYTKCDGIRDCLDGTDEMDCTVSDNTPLSDSLDLGTFGKMMGGSFIVIAALLCCCRMCFPKKQNNNLPSNEISDPPAEVTTNAGNTNINMNENDNSVSDRTYTSFPCAGPGQPPQSHRPSMPSETTRLTLPTSSTPLINSGESLVLPPPHEALTPDMTAPPPTYESLFPEAKLTVDNP